LPSNLDLNLLFGNLGHESLNSNLTHIFQWLLNDEVERYLSTWILLHNSQLLLTSNFNFKCTYLSIVGTCNCIIYNHVLISKYNCINKSSILKLVFIYFKTCTIFWKLFYEVRYSTIFVKRITLRLKPNVTHKYLFIDFFLLLECLAFKLYSL